MKTADIQIEQTFKSKSTIQIEIPSFWRSGSQYYKVYSEDKCLRVWSSPNLDTLNQIDIATVNSCFDNKDLKEITEALFDEQYTFVVEKFNKL